MLGGDIIFDGLFQALAALVVLNDVEEVAVPAVAVGVAALCVCEQPASASRARAERENERFKEPRGAIVVRSGPAVKFSLDPVSRTRSVTVERDRVFRSLFSRAPLGE